MVSCLKAYLELIRESIIICLIQHFEADFLWKVSLKILNSGIILKTFTHVHCVPEVITLVRLYKCADSPEPSLVANGISIKGLNSLYTHYYNSNLIWCTVSL